MILGALVRHELRPINLAMVGLPSALRTIGRSHTMSIVRQSERAHPSRACAHHMRRPKPEVNLWLMKRIDARLQFVTNPARPTIDAGRVDQEVSRGFLEAHDHEESTAGRLPPGTPISGVEIV